MYDKSNVLSPTEIVKRIGLLYTIGIDRGPYSKKTIEIRSFIWNKNKNKNKKQQRLII